MARKDEDTFRKDIYDLLKVRGYKPVPKNAANDSVPTGQEADVIQFTFIKNGKSYGKSWITVDDKNTTIYFDEEQRDSPNTKTPGADYDDTWTGFMEYLKQLATRRGGFVAKNEDYLGDDMKQREYYKMKERLGESWNPMGKKASYNDAVPSVKIILQHNRALEEGEQRYRNVARIFLENQDGERFLAPTTRPGIARVFAREIAEGGKVNGERWNHIKDLCEEYQKMAGFVRATRNGQFNEPAQELVNEGVNHYHNLRETLHKLSTHRGYQNYFESWTPTLMEGEGEDISEMFMSSSMDPRIESAMPILSRLKKPVTEMEEVDTLAEWADDVINEKLELDEGDVVKGPWKKHDDNEDDWDWDDESWIPSIEDFEQEEEIRNRKRGPANDVNEMDKEHGSRRDFDSKRGPDKTAKMMKAKDAVKAARKALDKAFEGDVDENFIGMSPQAVAEEEVEEGLGDKVKKGIKSLKRGMKGWEKGMHDVDSVKASTKTLSPDSKEAILKSKVGKGSPAELQQKLIKREKNKPVEEDLDANQERVNTLGPTEKVKNNNIGKLVGASESKEIDPELARIIEMARFKR